MVSFVYFDLGGVVILDFSGTDKWAQLKKELGIAADRYAEFDSFFNEREPEICSGVDVETLLPDIKERFDVRLPAGYSLLEGFVKRFEANKSIWPIIYNAHKKYRVGLLTNMYPNMFNSINKHGIMPDLKWDVIIDSSIERIQKPDKKIFELGETRANIKGNEIFFVDNNKKNVVAADNIGWKTFLYDPADCVKSNNNISKILFRNEMS